MSALISLKKLKKVFSTEEVDTHALSDIDLEIKSGEYVCISGPSGCGKSTLLSILGLLDTPSGGSFILNGTDVCELDAKQRADVRKKEVGFVFQSFNLISDLTVEENVELPLTYRKELSKAERESMVANALEKVDMAHRRKHYPSQLSGGQQQRVAVARAVVGNPSIILADEPTGNLDSKNAEQVMSLLDQLHGEGATICMVTHDPRGVKRAKRSVEIFDGRVVADSSLSRPKKTEQSEKELATEATVA
ncbi:ABC transporter ATP-binding protein [Aliikangiella sp. G2MR2-5]|uniref:ABC transporter ATP-binding protein n=1 Tax=Aliikangiella sp. G2MR2-5 TaxID=2788943 RepID=UPI0018AA6C7A|nr:ABC transporter ATP-binding protein [Aliikangiella sp. G2MR2-5]